MVRAPKPTTADGVICLGVSRWTKTACVRECSAIALGHSLAGPARQLMRSMPSPTSRFRDPVSSGAVDPTLIWNRHERAWWRGRLNRRANVDPAGHTWVTCTGIGIATSSEIGQISVYRSMLAGPKFERGLNAFWEHEIIWLDDRYQLHASDVPSVRRDWPGIHPIGHDTDARAHDGVKSGHAHVLEPSNRATEQPSLCVLLYLPWPHRRRHRT